jgi:hypothetical protein
MQMLGDSALSKSELENNLTSLKHLFTEQIANTLQFSSLMNFREKGTKSLISYVDTCILHITHSFKKGKFKLVNFDSHKKSQNKQKQLSDAKKVDKILRKQI